MSAHGIKSASFACLLVAICAVSLPAFGQDAETYFHNGARSFLGDRLDEARSNVLQGLEAFPDDARLAALMDLIDQQQEQQDQQQQEQQQQGEQQDPQQGDQDQEQEQDPQQEQEQEQDGSGESDPQEESQETPEQDGEAPPRDQLSEDEARRILQAMEDDEEQLLREVQKIKTRPRRVEKDW